MLHYLGAGYRDYLAHPISLKRRPHWEFQAILSGSCTLHFSSHSVPVVGPMLWVFRPEVEHGWSSKTKTPCEITVFHFDYVPDIFAEHIGNREFFHICPVDVDIEMLRKAAAEINTRPEELTDASLLRYDILVHRLALLIIERSNIHSNLSKMKLNAQRVERALIFFRKHMSEGIGVEEVAKDAACSVAHLRRLFHSTLGLSVKTALLHEQMHLAADKLIDHNKSVSEVAELCGFSCISSFSRAFRNSTGICPSRWRESHPRKNPELNDGRRLVLKV